MDNNLITPDAILDTLLDTYPHIAEVIVAHAMVCVGCPISRFHTLAEIAAAYGLDVDMFIQELRQHVDSNQKR